jgi:hypothetical protein
MKHTLQLTQDGFFKIITPDGFDALGEYVETLEEAIRIAKELDEQI